MWAKLPKINKESGKNREERVKQSMHLAKTDLVELKVVFPQIPATTVLQ
jgi:hypothetical protein